MHDEHSKSNRWHDAIRRPSPSSSLRARPPCTGYFGDADFGGIASPLSAVLAVSPGGTYVLGVVLRPSYAVADAESGKLTQVEAPGYDRFSAESWIDDDTFTGLSIDGPRDTTPVNLLACEVGGECRVIAPRIGLAKDLVLPGWPP